MMIVSGHTPLTPGALLHRHRLSPGEVNAWMGEGTVPEEIEEKVGAMKMVLEYVRITEAFQEKGIPVLPMKGPALSYRLYGDPANRRSGDLDLLVQVDHIGKAISLLQELGYRDEGGTWPMDAKRQKRWIRHTDDIAFLHPGKQILVELHWRLLKRPRVTYSRLEEMVWEDTPAAIDFADHTFPVLSHELELLYLVIHGGHHWWRMLKWLVDVNVYLKTQPVEWNRFSLLVRELKAEQMVALANAMLAEYFPGGKQMPVAQDANPFMVRFSRKMIRSEKDLVADFYSRIVQSVYYELISFPGIRYKWRTVRDYFFVPEFFGKNRIMDTLPLYYFYGSLRLLMKRATLRRKD